MRDFLKVIIAAAWTLPAGTALAQDVWLQVEAQPGLARAQQAASGYAQRLQDVAGFRLGQSNWYAIVLGPLSEGEAASLRSRLRSSGAIPADAFVSDGTNYGAQFWPIGAPLAEPAATPAPVVPVAPSPSTGVQPQDADQTLAEARVGETLLSREERIEIQRQLRRLGFYDSLLDGAFGRGSRAAMSDWQEARGFPGTGVLTEGQRASLAEEYAAVVAADGRLPETLAEARQSESLLSQEERERLQIALQWAGVYNGAIDGAFGRGTRASMGEWQRQKGFEVTGVLTTRQREQLIDEYNAILAGLGLEEVRDETAGIAITLPTELVALETYEPPFAQYNARTAGAAHRVILISQRGDRNTLHGLYDIMQTLEIVPETGPREKTDQGFTLVGQNAAIVSHTEARLVDGAIKGFTLVWPTGDEERRARLLAEMRSSFRPIDGVVMDDRVPGSGTEQRIDLVSGLRIRQPELSRTGVFVDARGTLLTSADILKDCGKITLNDDVEATVKAADAATGLALLTPNRSLAPLDFARFTEVEPRLQSDVAVAGYSFEGVLGAPSLTFGKLADVRALDGSDGIDRLALSPQPGDVGGPVLNAEGAVVGLLLPRVDTDGRVLPQDVSFSADVGTISTFLEANGVRADLGGRSGLMTTEQLTFMAADITALVSCWQ